MKITIDRDMTEAYLVDRTKAQMKEFKEIYTDGDLLRMFREAINCTELGYNFDIIRCNLRAFPGGWAESDETHYCVEMLLEGFKEFYKVYFYITQSGEVDTRKDMPVRYSGGVEYMSMYGIKRYTEA